MLDSGTAIAYSLISLAILLIFLGGFYQAWRENRKRDQVRKARRDYFKRHFKPHDFED